MTGTIKHIEEKKGFGFIRGEDGADYFMHKSAVALGVEFGSLTKGEAVESDTEESSKGPRAVNVERA